MSRRPGTRPALRNVFPVLADMVGWHKRGTRYGIAVDPADGLLRAGEAGVQLTWMDAKVGDWVVTPRIGKPVEINALWYNALCIMADFAAMLGEADSFSADAAPPAAGFARFVRADGEGLIDVDRRARTGWTTRIRPNQIFAVSLPHSPLATADQLPRRRNLPASFADVLRSAIARAGQCRLPSALCGRRAPARRRLSSGSRLGVAAWAISCWLRIVSTGDADAALALLAPMRDTLFDQGLGTIGEIFDGDPPHDPRGAPAQAWSVACTLQAWHALRATRSEGP